MQLCHLVPLEFLCLLDGLTLLSSRRVSVSVIFFALESVLSDIGTICLPSLVPLPWGCFPVFWHSFIDSFIYSFIQHKRSCACPSGLAAKGLAWWSVGGTNAHAWVASQGSWPPRVRGKGAEVGAQAPPGDGTRSPSLSAEAGQAGCACGRTRWTLRGPPRFPLPHVRHWRPGTGDENRVTSEGSFISGCLTGGRLGMAEPRNSRFGPICTQNGFAFGNAH